MSNHEIPRTDLVNALVTAAQAPTPLLLTGPPGSGKTSLLLQAGEALERRGWVCVYLDMMAAASSPDRFVRAALGALPGEHFDDRQPQTAGLRRLAGSGRSQEHAAVQGLLSLWACLEKAGERPVALLLDEITEIRSLAYFPGLREVDRPFGAALAGRRGGTLLASSFPTLAAQLWPRFGTLVASPLSAGELGPAAERLGLDPPILERACFGWPRYARILLDAMEGEDSLALVWAREMTRGGRLEVCCRHTYETLLLRSRGYGMSKAVLATVAEEEGLNLKALVGLLGRTPGAVRDYLCWLLAVDALRKVKKRYYYVDGMLRIWVRLHARGTPPTAAELQSVAHGVTGLSPDEPRAEARVVNPVATREDSLMEID